MTTRKHTRYGVCPDCGQTLHGRAVLPHTRARAADATWVELPVHNRVPRDQLRAGQVLVVCLPRGRRRAVPALPLASAGDTIRVTARGSFPAAGPFIVDAATARQAGIDLPFPVVVDPVMPPGQFEVRRCHHQA